MAIWGWLGSQEHAETAAFAATLLCVWVAAQATVMMRGRPPRVFTAAALFTLNWAILLLYYVPGPPQNEILSSLSGFVLVYVGILLVRQGARGDRHDGELSVGWLDRLPLHLMRITLGGFGLYLVLRQLFRVEYGYGTLALALWGTALTVLGYAAVWAGMVVVYQHHRSLARIAGLLAALLVVYASAEVTYAVWYARDRWPVYHRFLMLGAQPGAPSFEQALPADPQPDWPEAPKWYALARRPDWPHVRGLLALTVQPRLPDMWVWLKVLFSVLKLLFTAAFLWLVWKAPAHETTGTPTRLVQWLRSRLRLGAS